MQPSTTKTPEFESEIRALRPDALVVVAYGEILRPNVLTLGSKGAINLHASLLPKFRGAAPIAWAILLGEAETGASTMQINETMDAGPVFLQEKCEIFAADTAETLSQRIASLGAPLLKRTLDLIENDEIRPEPQIATEVTFAPKLKKQDGVVDWEKDAGWISRQIRAFNPWPGSYSHLKEVRIKLWMANEIHQQTSEIPGTVLEVLKDAFYVACGKQTVLELKELQPENRPRMRAADFVHGYRIQVGDRFSSK
jgi:methionyl-tRNA formyltransferase